MKQILQSVDGIRRAETLTAETDDDLETLTRQLACCTFPERLELAERLARRVLGNAGLPTEWGHYLVFRDGRIEPAPPDAANGSTFHPDADAPDHWKCKTLAGLTEPAPSLTNDAAQVLSFAAAVRQALAGDVDAAKLARCAMRLGESFEHLRLSVVNGWRLADEGLHHARWRKQGSEKTAKKAERERIARQSILDRVIADNPNPPKLDVWFQDFAALHKKERPKAKTLTEGMAKAFYYEQKRLKG